MAQDPYKYFRPEARDLVDQFAKGVLALERGGGGKTAVQNLLRLAHTLKGAARVVKQPEIANLAHAIEDTLSPLRDDGASIARGQIDKVLGHLDDISGRIAELSRDAKEAAEPPGKAEIERGPRTARTDVAETDAVLEGVAEAHAVLNGLRNAATGIEQARRLADALLTQIAAPAAPDRARLTAGANSRANIAEELRRRFGRIERELGSSIDQMDRELRQLREAAERLRLLSVTNLFTALERTARDTARAQSKQVDFTATGADIRLDSYVLETVQSALIQIVRNAVAHGIEPANDRSRAGKPAAGVISVEVSRRGRQIVFACRDDGRGIDLDAVRRIAQQREMEGASSGQADGEDVMRLLLRGGISTSQTVTKESGRGVGLDVVREAVERLGGKVNIDTKRGAGTTFELIIPPSLASVEALIVEAGGGVNTVSVPLNAVRASLRIKPQDVSHGSSNATVTYGKTAIPFMPLSTAFAGLPWSAGRNWTAIVVAGAMGLVALGVDRLVGAGPTVVRALPDGMAANPAVAGASLDAEGNPQLVVDPDGLVASVFRGTSAQLDPQSTRRPVLVVDDSMTTRMLEKSILESAGYEVDVALSGEEALACLTRKRFSLILVDVEMPGMDGFTFIERLRADPAIRDTPAILVTSRNSPDDLKRGRDVGANGHIVKSEFNQAELLTMIESLTG